MARRYEFLIDILDLLGTGRVRLWTGESELTIAGHTWTPTNIVDSVSIAAGQLANTETRLTLGLFATTDALRSMFLQDPGPAQITVRQVVSLNDGLSWTLVPRAFTGRLSVSTLQGDRYMVDLVDRLGDPLRPAALYWSDEDQQRRHPGDRGLKYMKRIDAGIDVQWP